jgi:hypothetical protein
VPDTSPIAKSVCRLKIAKEFGEFGGEFGVSGHAAARHPETMKMGLSWKK